MLMAFECFLQNGRVGEADLVAIVIHEQHPVHVLEPLVQRLAGGPFLSTTLDMPVRCLCSVTSAQRYMIFILKC